MSYAAFCTGLACAPPRGVAGLSGGLSGGVAGILDDQIDQAAARMVQTAYPLFHDKVVADLPEIADQIKPLLQAQVNEIMQSAAVQTQIGAAKSQALVAGMLLGAAVVVGTWAMIKYVPAP